MSIREVESSRQRTTRLIAVVVGAVVIGVGGWFMMSSANPFGLGQAKVLTVDGLEAFVDDVDEEFGTTEVVEAYLFDGYATVELPVSGDTKRTITYKYDGGFSESRKDTRTADESMTLIDLRELDVERTLALLPEAPATVGLPDGEVGTVAIRLAYGPDSVVADMPEVSIHVDTEFGESGSVRADLSGDIVSVDTAAE